MAWLQRSKARCVALLTALIIFGLLIASAPKRSRVRLEREHRPPTSGPRRACFVLDDARVERSLLVTYVQLMQALARELDGELSVLSLGPRPGQLSAQQWLKQWRVPTSDLLWHTLPPSAHWITDTRVVFLRKLGTDTPRPIRVGGVWRRVVAKGLAASLPPPPAS